MCHASVMRVVALSARGNDLIRHAHSYPAWRASIGRDTGRPNGGEYGPLSWPRLIPVSDRERRLLQMGYGPSVPSSARAALKIKLLSRHSVTIGSNRLCTFDVGVW